MEEVEFVRHEPCPNCHSSDNLARYSDGHGYCFGCKHYEKGEPDVPTTESAGDTSSADPDARGAGAPGGGDGDDSNVAVLRTANPALIHNGEARPLIRRGITVETAEKWKYRVAEYSGQTVQVADYYDPTGRQVVAQKVRFANKKFIFLGEPKLAGLYGQQLWRDGGKMVVVTEGEIDALSVSQLQGNKWPVVSVPSGAAGAKKALARQLEWLLGFDTVILMFDNDDPGQEASRECAALFPVGRCKIASLPLKDPNEMLQAGRGREVIDAMWGAKLYRPDGIVTLAEVRDEVLKSPVNGLPWCFETLTKLTYGRRHGELYAVGAGTGVGKTDFLTQQIKHDLVDLGMKVGLIFLEQQPVETVKRIAGKLAEKRFHVPSDVAGWSQDELVAAMDQLKDAGGLYLYDHFGSADWDTIKARIRYLAQSEDVQIFYLDHLTALAATAADERRTLETIMAELGGLVKELRIILTFVSHLATPEGRPHEEGGRVMIRHFKGSRAIGFWSHYMFGLERDQQAEEIQEQKDTTFRILKDRYTGDATGKTFHYTYNATTGLLHETNGVGFEPEVGEGGDF